MTVAAALRQVDLRTLAAGQQSAVVVAHARGLAGGGAFELVADADPSPLLAQLAEALPGRVRWEHIDSAPLWRVRVERPGHGANGASCCGSCGGGA